MTITIDDPGPALTVEAVDVFEQTLPGPLPADYRSFLLRSNGGWPESNWWPPERGDGDFNVDNFLSLSDVPTHRSIAASRETFEGRVPSHLLVFAYDDFGNQFCLSLAPEDHGKVYFFDHELEVDEDEEPFPELLTPVTDTFTAFFEALEPRPAPEEALRRLDAASTQ